MKKLNIFWAGLIVSAMSLSVCYSFGVLGGGNSAKVNNGKFGDFTYTGNLLDGHFDGKGHISLDGEYNYNGEFSDGQFNGNGVFDCGEDNSEWRFEGNFKNGLIEKGVIYLFDTEVSYISDSGSETLSSDSWKYSGSFGEKGQHGSGVFTFNDGSSYSGTFLWGRADGEGEFKDRNGKTVYKGGFKEGVFEGAGIYYSPDGWSYEGNFSGGLFDGNGAVTVDGTVIRGIWEKGVQVIRYE